MSRLIAVVLVAGLSFSTGFAQAPVTDQRQLEISFSGSNVTLKARNVSLPQILAEWARLSGCVILNAERLPSTPITIPVLYENMSQRAVLESLLRPAAGFILSPRTAGRAGATDFELVYILATSNPTPSGYAGGSTYQPPVTAMDPTELPPNVPPPPQPQPQQPPPDNAPPPAARPGGIPGVQVPIIAVPPATSTGRGRGGF
jgi:hypothetical protein